MAETLQIVGVPLPLPDNLDERMILAGTLITLMNKGKPPINNIVDIMGTMSLAYSFVLAQADGSWVMGDYFKESFDLWLTSREAFLLLKALRDVGVIAM